MKQYNYIMSNDPFSAKIELQSVNTIIINVNSKDSRIVLDPVYQRNIVWAESDMANFINSVLKGIAPNNVLFNKDENGNSVCIDGKQRITSLCRFKDNKFPVELEENNKTIYAYYDTLPKKYKDDENYRTLTQIEKNKFNDVTIPIVIYNNLSYENQIDVFHRIQHGKVLTTGEKFKALFTNDKVATFYEKFCDSKLDLFTKFENKFSNERKEHLIKIINMMYMVFKDKCKPFTTEKIKLAYVKSLDNIVSIKKETEKISKLIDMCYSPNIMGHNIITSKLSITMHYLVAKLIYSLFSDKDYKITDKEAMYIRNAIKDTNKDIENEMSNVNTKKKNIKTNEDIYKLLNDYYEGLVSGDHCITEENDNVDYDESNENDSKEESEEEQPIIPVKKQPVKRNVNTKSLTK